MTQETGLSIRTFEDYTHAWAEFIAANRKHKGEGKLHPYDIVIGPIADDTIGVKVHNYLKGRITIDQLIEELRFKEHSVQYYFGTEKAVALLKKVSL